jgi:hypothetical protein
VGAVGIESIQSPCIHVVSGTYEEARGEIGGLCTRNAKPVDQPLAQDTCNVHTVESALAMALTDAAKAGQWVIVAQLAKELEARRLEDAPNVVRLVSKPT